MLSTLRLSLLCLLAAGTLPAQALYVNSRGTGQVLLFPYYTVNVGQQTLFSVVNTTDRSKLVSVNFREAYNGRLVMRFDVVLAARDTWTATTFTLGGLRSAAQIGVRDNSCTVPGVASFSNPGTSNGGPSQEFLTFDYIAVNQDGGPQTEERTREGYFEIVERAELAGDLNAAANQRDCDAFQDLTVVAANPAIRAPGGGLRGSFAVVNVAQGTILGGNATAIEGFSTTPLLSTTVTPDRYDTFAAVNAGGSAINAQVLTGGKRVDLLYQPNRSVDALSAVLMTDTLLADVSRETGLGSNSEWVVTAPTKRFHADGDRALTQLAPFAERFGATYPAAACTGIGVAMYDRSGRSISLTSDPALGTPPGQPSLCYATNVVAFNPGATGLLGTGVLGSAFDVPLSNPTPAAETGSLELTLGVTGATRSYLPAGTIGPGLRGLPVIGFEAVKYVNGNVTPGVLANYTLARPLSSTASCTSPNGALIACP